MKVNEILEALKQQAPQALGKVPEKRAEAIIAAALRVIKQAVEHPEEGVVPVAGLGRFVVKQVTSKKDRSVSRVVVLRQPKPKAAE